MTFKKIPGRSGYSPAERTSKMGYFDLPTKCVWDVEYYTGVVKTTVKCRDGVVRPLKKPIRLKASCYFKTKEQAEAKAAELRKDGYEVIGICEAII